MFFKPIIQSSAGSLLLLLLGSLAEPVLSHKPGVPTLDYFRVADGANYAYTFTPAQGTNATFLLLHGYPSTHKDWEPQIAALTAAGFGTLVPDMLGFGASDMPTEPSHFNAKRLSGHLAELLDQEGLDSVIGVGHDWGSVVLSRMAVYHNSRFDKLAWLNVGHQGPGGFVDVDGINANAQTELGYMPLGYWYFFTRHNAGTTIKNHLESHYHLVFPENHTVWRNYLTPVGAASAWLNADTLTEDPSFLDEAYKADWLSWMSRPNATESSLNIYKSQYQGFNEADEAELREEDWTLNVPVLGIAGSLDPVARADSFIDGLTRWSAAGLEMKTLEGGHWLPKELPNEVNELLLNFGRS